MKYEVTIGIPVYRAKPYIRQTLESALAQTYPSVEFLLVDDGGADGTMEVVYDLKQQHPRGADIHVITHSANLGVADSRNDLIDKAQGTYLFFLDSDDTIRPDAISLLVGQAQQHTADIVFGSYEKLELSGQRVLYQYPSCVFLKADEFASFAYRKFGGIQASACNYLVKTSLLRSCQLHFIHTDYWEDMVFTHELVTHATRAVLLPDITYSYRCREGSLSHYQERELITKDEVMRNVRTIDYLKRQTRLLYNKVYYPNRCRFVVMTDFYMACTILKRRKSISPAFTPAEIRQMMAHPASFPQLCRFRQARLPNLFLYILGRLPARLCVATILLLGKAKKLI